MIVGCYTLHVYCGNSPAGGQAADTCQTPVLYRHAWPGEFSGRCEIAARYEARQKGWKFAQHNVYCKACGGPRKPSKQLLESVRHE